MTQNGVKRPVFGYLLVMRGAVVPGFTVAGQGRGDW
jgi:hypothetical protein